MKDLEKDLYAVAQGYKRISEVSELDNNQNIICTINPKTSRYLDANKTMLDALITPLAELIRMCGYDNALKVDDNIDRLNAYYYYINYRGEAHPLIKTSLDANGGLVSYKVETVLLNADKILCYAQLLPGEPHQFTDNIIRTRRFTEPVGHNR